MPDVVAVLLVPAEGDPHGLLLEGPRWGQPPRICGSTCPTCGAHSWLQTSASTTPLCVCGSGMRLAGASALLLEWDGEPVRLGLLWLAWALEDAGWEPLADENQPHEFTGWRAYDLTPRALAGFAAQAGLGTVVLLDTVGS